MTQQAQNDPNAVLPSLAAKLNTLLDGLTPEEEVQLYGMPSGLTNATISPSLREKLQRSARALTSEEQAQIRTLAAQGRPDRDGDTTGHMIAQYDDGLGNKGRPKPVEGTGGGGAIVGAIGSEIWKRSGIPDAIKAINWFL